MSCFKYYVAFLLLAANVMADETPEHRLIVGWDDAVIVCGPGTDAGMDSPEAIERIVKRWKARGLRGVYWRVDEAMLPARFMSRWDVPHAPGQQYLFRRVDETLEKFPVQKTLLAAAEREGIEVWAWYPTIYSGGAPLTGGDFKYPWLYENKVATDHPEILTVDRAGRKQFMVWEYAYPEARQAKVSEFVQFAKDYGFKRFVACLRTEAAQNQPAPKHADQFGFNAPVVADMKRRHGIDILTDPRFDFAHSKFDLYDPMVENWRKLRGEFLTMLYRELRAGLNAVDPQIKIAVQIPGDRAGTCLGNWHLDWRTWIDEGLIDEIVVPVVLDGYEGYGSTAAAKAAGYIDAAVSTETVRKFVKQSRRPNVKVIQAGGPMTGFRSPPPQADGWRLDAWPDLWTFNMAQRWEQWHRNFAEFGHIKFIEQSFDAIERKHGSGYGDFCHRPDLRSGPGFWEVLGDGSDAKPVAQSRVRRGDKGQAMQLKRAADGSANLTVRHHGRHDRSLFPFPGDTAISSGSCQLDFWVLRPEAQSAFVAYLQYDFDPANRFEVGLYVPPGDAGAIYFYEAGKSIASKATLPVGEWQRVSLIVNLERRVYSAEVATAGGDARQICRNVKYKSQHNAFNMIEFSPQGGTGSLLFLDDVSLRWIPAVMLAAPGAGILAEDGFESRRPDESPDPERWTVRDGRETDIRIDNDISYGREFQSLRFRGAGGRALLRSPLRKRSGDAPLTVDVDVFLRSENRFVQMLPTAGISSSDEVGIAVKPPGSDKPFLEVRTRGGHWHVGTGGRLSDTKLAAAFDAWNHLQLVINPKSRQCIVRLQVIGEPPRELHRTELTEPIVEAMAVELFCIRSKPLPDGPAFDNLVVSYPRD